MGSEDTMEEEQFFRINLVVVNPPKNSVRDDTMKIPDCGIMNG